MTAKDSQKLKELRTRLAKLQVQSENAYATSQEYLQKNKAILNKIKNIQEEIRKLSLRELVVSEHAILRYLERQDYLDLEFIKESILTDEVKAFHKKLGNGKYPIGNTKLRAVIRDNVVVSVVGS